LRRRIDGRGEIVYTFPRDFVLRPGKTVKVKTRKIKLLFIYLFIYLNT